MKLATIRFPGVATMAILETEIEGIGELRNTVRAT